MKKVNYKTEFKNLKDAIAKVPEVLKENNNEFIMSDGNKTFKLRWEGTLTEGTAVALLSKDEKLIKEDVDKMMHLIGYSSEATLGNLNGDGRINEDIKINELTRDTKQSAYGKMRDKGQNLRADNLEFGDAKLDEFIGMELPSFNNKISDVILNDSTLIIVFDTNKRIIYNPKKDRYIFVMGNNSEIIDTFPIDRKSARILSQIVKRINPESKYAQSTANAFKIEGY